MFPGPKRRNVSKPSSKRIEAQPQPQSFPPILDKCTTIFLIAAGLIVMINLISTCVSLVTVTQLNRRLDVYRFCLEWKGGADVFDANGNGDADAGGGGYFLVDTHSRALEWSFEVGNLDSTATALEIRGPLNTSLPIHTGNVYKSLSVESSDNIRFQDRIKVASSESNHLVEEPWQFYLLLRTSSHPSGAIRAKLGVNCYLNKNP